MCHCFRIEITVFPPSFVISRVRACVLYVHARLFLVWVLYECLIDWWFGFFFFSFFICFCNLNSTTAVARFIHVGFFFFFTKSVRFARLWPMARITDIFISLNELFVLFSDFVFVDQMEKRKKRIFFRFGKHLLRFKYDGPCDDAVNIQFT